MTRKIHFFFLLLFCVKIVAAQEAWPRILETKDAGRITIYQPQPEKLSGNIVTGRTAVSVKQKTTDDPVFGVLWFTATMETNRDNRMALLEKIKINEIRLPGIEDTAKISKLKALLEKEIPKWQLKTTVDELAATVEQAQNTYTDNFKNEPPKIIYTTQPSTLVLIDGEPKAEQDDQLKMKRVINSAFLIVQYPADNKYYLYGGNTWYTSASITTGWATATKLPKEIQELNKQIKEQEQKQGQAKSAAASTGAASAIIVSTEPSELIQSKGEASFTNISGTNLLYVSNSDDNIFMDISSSKYYVVLSGRWYTAGSLKGPWTFVASDQLPGDFAKIPKGSEKDAVLASVAGTAEAHDAVIDAQIPQTAKVERSSATCSVKYDGEPKFEKIEGTSLYLAKNTSSTVIRSGDSYYCVENAVWFKSSAPSGPWIVSDDRPKDVDNIPANSQAYNVKYVYIYETTPQYVYVGYTPGYMGCFVYGPVVIYGTGFYYNPWYGMYYYPRPVTYGFSMHYNPFTGWSIGFHYSVGFFSFHYYTGGYHGYWGPPVYRPPYYPHYHGGMYGGRGPTYIGGDVNINIDNSKNIYTNRNGVTTSDIKRNGSNSRPANSDIKKNDVLPDKDGNLFKRGSGGSWQQLNNKEWKPANNAAINNLDKEMQSRERSETQNKNFNQVNRAATPVKKPKK